MSIDPFDFKEPHCALCGGKDFYYPDKNKPAGTIPVPRILEKADALFDKNDYPAAGRLLENWQREAEALGDKRGELSVVSELMGYYRKINDKEKGLKSVERGLALIDELSLGGTVSAATVQLNAATTMKAFGKAADAVALYAETEKIYLENLSPSDARFGGLYNNYALALTDVKRFADAEESYKKALGVMEKTEHGEADAAITYVNMAHLYETWKEESEEFVSSCMERAKELLDTPSLPRNGYYAFVCSKCAPSFGYFGYFLEDAELKKRAEEIYERA